MMITLVSLVMLAAEALAAEQINFPDASVVNQRGEAVHFHADLIKGKTVVIDFVFTSCTIVCRPLTRNLQKVQAGLGKETLSDVQFVSVSVDPVHDTPAVLASFAQAFRIAPNWSFITGPKVQIDKLLQAPGVYAVEPNYHTARVIIGSEAAGWSRFYGLSSPEMLAQAVRRAVQMRKEQKR